MRPTTRPIPLPGEGFDGYLERLSAVLDAPLGLVLDAVGLPRGYRAGWGVYLTPELTADVADALDLDPAAVRAMTICAYAHAVTPPEPFDPMTFGIWAATEWVHVGGSPYCPRHLAQSATWLLAHRFAISIGCTDHATALVDRCPNCAQWPHGGRRTSGQPLFTDRPRLLGRCHRPDVSTENRTGRASEPCLGDLRTASTLPLDPVELAWQSDVDSILANRPVTVAGVTIPAKSGVRALREVLALQHRLEVTRVGTTTGRFWRSPPRDLALTRRLVRSSGAWTRAPDMTTAAAAFVEAAVAAGAALTSTAIRQSLPARPSSCLDPMINQVLRQTGRPSSRLNRARGQRPGRFRNLPQLAWPCAVPSDLHQLRRPALGVLRAYASLAIARTDTPTWAAAGRAVGIGEDAAIRISRYVHGSLTRPDLDSIGAHLQRVAELVGGATLPATWPTARLPRYRLPPLTSARCGDDTWCPCTTDVET